MAARHDRSVQIRRGSPWRRWFRSLHIRPAALAAPEGYQQLGIARPQPWNCRLCAANPSRSPLEEGLHRSMDCEARHGNFDFADFAQEFLRRGRTYRDQYTRISAVVRNDPGAAICREMALSWGLVFPGSPGFGSAFAAGNLERDRCCGSGRDGPGPGWVGWNRSRHAFGWQRRSGRQDRRGGTTPGYRRSSGAASSAGEESHTPRWPCLRNNSGRAARCAHSRTCGTRWAAK